MYAIVEHFRGSKTSWFGFFWGGYTKDIGSKICFILILLSIYVNRQRLHKRHKPVQGASPQILHHYKNKQPQRAHKIIHNKIKI